MPRKQSIPWMHRWSRPLIAGIATLGAVVTAYLTYTKLTGDAAACPTKGCDIVLSSPYATVFGQPLALFGFLAYTSMIVLAIAPLLVSSSRNQIRAQIEAWTGLMLFLGGTAMLVFSIYLMYLLTFEIQAPCIYCIASAILSLSLFVLALLGRDWQDIGLPLFAGGLVAILVVVGTLGVYANINNPAIAESNPTQPLPGGYTITTTSGEAEIALAKHLAKVKAIMYGAFWCPHCHDQKQLFGQEAVQYISYIECDPSGINPQPQRCQAANVQGFPTWSINGQTVTGVQTLEELAKLSGYQGSRNFKNVESLRS
ncbi:vitamin K epoxide reductase family protein [Gloeocapsopsis sp. IPPAS B-1203]|uniref:vitamin K epoxide reductase family protein n=1 Tax=Gloeocapsopsis sp. IPPAS B-1203 TaxID=2049454 RepID=UPI000C18B705|nr:vitamin K epoxide reductase family protein [Gloeocapsopsis sp. IPPAS B-1203]PIG91627.1 hypothetical protein CSQ79_20565 [Gloeocapsopsis sp. IPPAS B-1203]